MFSYTMLCSRFNGIQRTSIWHVAFFGNGLYTLLCTVFFLERWQINFDKN